MAFTVDHYAELRPFLYHVTARENLPRLKATRRIDAASTILRKAGRNALVRARRPEPITVSVGEDSVVLKDQRPLIASNVSLTGGWQFPDFVEYLNDHVYFWPGDALGLILSGRRMLAHYAAELPLVLRAPFHAVLTVNPTIVPLFSCYNSGALRMQRGKPVKRGADLFRTADRTGARRHEVVEVAFRATVHLPPATAIAGAPEEWTPLWAAT